MSTASLPRPPRRVAPEQFYCDYLPQLWGELARGIRWPDWRFELAFKVAGETYTVAFAAGALTGRAGGGEEPLVTFESDLPSWQLATHDLLPRVIRWVNRRLDEAHADLSGFVARRGDTLCPDDLRRLPGHLELRFTDDAGDRGAYHCRVGDGTGPRAGVEASEEDLWALLDSKGRIASLLKSRAIIDGDLAWVMRLATLAEPTAP